jgi:hypothetical protein
MILFDQIVDPISVKFIPHHPFDKYIDSFGVWMFALLLSLSSMYLSIKTFVKMRRKD